jgi:dimethylhistidine N-methyltransferase
LRLLPCKLFYDQRGSQLFDQICASEDYYPTRTETAIMGDHGQAMADTIGPDARMVELGSGSSTKTRLLLEHLIDAGDAPAAYVPIDISKAHLQQAAQTLAGEFPAVQVMPVCADYMQRFTLPQPDAGYRRTVAYFPGSTIGNFHLDAALAFLKRIRDLCEPEDTDGHRPPGLLIGVDLRKDPELLRRAYNDRDGVTAEFNFNLLDRLNREWDGDFDREAFDYRAQWNDADSRIESSLISTRDQTVHVAGQAFELTDGERIRTECSYKYTVDSFAELARQAGWTQQQVWTDARDWFSVQYLTAD